LPKNETQNTNLASEFYIASLLFRLGYSVTITLGHTKEIDLIVTNKNSKKISVDVKGLGGKTNWPIKPKLISEDHFYVLVTYLNKFRNLEVVPEVYIIPSLQVRDLITDWTTRSGITYKDLKNSRFKDAWHLLFK
jgi:hypothetical protein